jgi:hypothetical protein
MNSLNKIIMSKSQNNFVITQQIYTFVAKIFHVDSMAKRYLKMEKHLETINKIINIAYFQTIGCDFKKITKIKIND